MRSRRSAWIEDFALGDAVLHVVDGVADDDGDENLDDVVKDGRDPTPGEVFPVSPEVGCERFEFVEHMDFASLVLDQMKLAISEDAELLFRAWLDLAGGRCRSLAWLDSRSAGLAGVALDWMLRSRLAGALAVRVACPRWRRVRCRR